MATASMSWAKKRTSIWGLTAIIAALLTGLIIYSYLSWLRSQIPVAGPLVSVVVAKLDLAPGSVIGEGNIALRSHPERYLPDLAITEMASVVGQVASVPIFAGEILTSQKIGETGGLSALVPEGKRAFSLSVESGTVFGFAPRPGDKVDVLVTFPREVTGEPKTKTILRSAEIAAVGGESTPGELPDRLGIETVTSGLSITLFVTPEQAEALALAEALGRITVILAPLGEEEPVTQGITPGELIER